MLSCYISFDVFFFPLLKIIHLYDIPVLVCIVDASQICDINTFHAACVMTIKEK